jgi:hypothetical protein
LVLVVLVRLPHQTLARMVLILFSALSLQLVAVVVVLAIVPPLQDQAHLVGRVAVVQATTLVLVLVLVVLVQPIKVSLVAQVKQQATSVVVAVVVLVRLVLLVQPVQTVAQV